MYSLAQLFKLENNNEMTVTCGLSKHLQIKIDKPKQDL
jgi:hypothetical protein